jgi:hypothetical protein
MVEVFETGTSEITKFGTEFALKAGGVAAGLVIGSKLGGLVESYAVAPVTATSTTTDKFLGWAANNVPKGLGALGLASVKTGKGWLDNLITGGVYGLAGDVGIDSYARLTNKGAPIAKVGGAPGDNVKIQSLMAENAQLKAALEKMSGPLVKAQPQLPYGVPQFPYTAAPTVEEIQQKKYQFAPGQGAPVTTEQRYAFAGREVTSPEVLVQAFGFTRGE